MINTELSPIARRRWENFKKNKRGYYSLWIFTILFVACLFAEFIANDKPIIASINDRIIFPVVFTYTEKELGGVLETEAYYKDPFITNLIDQSGWAIWPPIPYSYDTIDWELEAPFPHPPDERHILGTDGANSDVLAKLIYGFRLSVLFGLAMAIISTIIGVTVGALQGYFGGSTDLVGQRILEIWQGLPVLFLLIILASMVEPTILWLLLVLSLFSWTALVGVVRAEFLRARNLEFVRAARSLGVSDRIIMIRHVLPNAMVATLTYMPFILNGAITFLTAIDFLGFGLPVDSASLGRLLGLAKANLHAPWIGMSAFLTLATLLTLLIFVGEAVRDAFDPRRIYESSHDDNITDEPNIDQPDILGRTSA